MNLVLLRARFPPVAIRLEDRATYLQVLQSAASAEGRRHYDDLMFQRLDATLDEYLAAGSQAIR